MSNNKNKENALGTALTIGSLGIFTGALVLVGTKLYNGESFAIWLNKPDTISEINIDALNGEEINYELLRDSDVSTEEVVEQEEQEEQEETKKDVKTVVYEIVYGINGVNPWGNGQDRINNLKNAGYTNEEINEISREIEILMNKTNINKNNSVKNTYSTSNEVKENYSNTGSNNNEINTDHPEYGKIISRSEKIISENTEQHVIGTWTDTTGNGIISTTDEVVNEEENLPDLTTGETPNETKTGEKTGNPEETPNETKIEEEIVDNNEVLPDKIEEKSVDNKKTDDTKEKNNDKEDKNFLEEQGSNDENLKIIESYEEVIDDVVYPDGYSEELETEETQTKTR